MAQLTRLAYCDSGIIKKVFETAFGEDNNEVMATIGGLEIGYVKERRRSLVAQKESAIAKEIPQDLKRGIYGVSTIPHESYALGPVPDTTKHKYATYISSRKALCAIVLNASLSNGILLRKGQLEKTDIIISFKGTNTFKEAVHDIKSQFGIIPLNDIIRLLGLPVIDADNGSNISKSFVTVLLHSWNIIIKAISEHSGGDSGGEFRLFCTGHSLGGAYCTILGFLLGYIKNLPNTNSKSESNTIKLVKRIKSIHIISLGAPTICNDKCRNVFNRCLISRDITFDRLVSQKAPSLAAWAIFRANAIPSVPVAFTHPGFKPKVTLYTDPNRPYRLSEIGKMYGIPKDKFKEYYFKPIDPNTLAELKEAGAGAEAAAEAGAAEAGAAEGEAGAGPVKGGNRTRRNNRKFIKARGKTRKIQRGGLFGFGKEKQEYEKIALTQASNFISISCPGSAWFFPHIAYLGMQYMTSLRTLGMINPVPNNIDKFAYFGFYSGKSANDKKLNLHGSTTTGNLITNTYRSDTNITEGDRKEGVLIKYIDCPGYSFKELKSTRKLSNTGGNPQVLQAAKDAHAEGAVGNNPTSGEEAAGNNPTSGEEAAGNNPMPGEKENNPTSPLLVTNKTPGAKGINPLGGMLLGGSKRVTAKR